MKLENVFKHFWLITRHKWVVFKLCLKVGEPWRGFWHDMSKYSFTEFWEGVKYFNGSHSPIAECKKKNGYSKAWLHHKGRNKHHTDYWIDLEAPNKTPIMPYKYVAEMLCDKLAAGIIYKGKDWTKEYELSYWLNEREKALINPKINNLITEFLTQVSEKGIDPVLTKENVHALYNKHCVEKTSADDNFSKISTRTS